jgi:hypothetical protein
MQLAWRLIVERGINAQNDDDWRCLLGFLPENWEQMASDGGALRRLRGFSDVGRLLRTLLIHLLDGTSLRQTVVQAKQMGIADVSDVALLKRLNASGDWFRQMACSLMRQTVSEDSLSVLPKDYDVVLVDATCISKPASTGTDWRVHYSIGLPSLECRTLIVSDKSVGETLRNFVSAPKRVFIGDRGYSCRSGIAHVVGQGGHVVIRMNTANLPLRMRHGKEFRLLEHLRKLATREIGEWDVMFDYENQLIAGRVCAIKKSRISAELAREKIILAASKKQKTPRPETLEAAGYIFVFTTMESTVISASKILEMYRGRWQIELAFKRLKSLLELGALPKKDPEGAKAWIYGKLFSAMLIESLIRNAEFFSPWGYQISIIENC